MNTFLSHPTPHIHAPNPDRISAIELSNEIKTRAAMSDEPSSAILHSALRTFPLSAAGEIPRSDIIMQTIRRQRATTMVGADGVLPEYLKTIDGGEAFVLHQDAGIIIFTTKSNVSVLKHSKHWFADGTFRVSDQLKECSCLINFDIGLSERFLSIIYITRTDDDSHPSRLWSLDWKAHGGL